MSTSTAAATVPTPGSRQTPNTTSTTATTANGNEAATKLAEALDDFLGDVERKFKGISEEILARLDEMAERCDRLEGELLKKESGRTGVAANTGGSTGGREDDVV